MTTTVIFGDVHGDAGKLRSLIQGARSRWGECDFYGLGDYIDRGPDSKGVIQTCVDEGVQGVYGNHELWFVKLLSEGYLDPGALHRMMGGRATLESYWDGMAQLKGAPPKAVRRAVETRFLAHVPESHKTFIFGLPLFMRVEVAGTAYWLIHAGIGGVQGANLRREVEQQLKARQVDVEITDQLLIGLMGKASPDHMVWEHIYAANPDLYAFEGVQVLGHTPLKEARDGGHYIALDTGCGRTRKPNLLSAVALHDDGTRTLFSV